MTTAGSAEEGLALAGSLHPDVITLDVLMPAHGWLGLSFPAQGATRRICDIPVIMVTLVDDKNLGYALGASEYLTKPVELSRLTALLHKFAGEQARRWCWSWRMTLTRATCMRSLLEREGWRVREAAARAGSAGTAWRRSDRSDPAGSDDAGDGRLRAHLGAAPGPRAATRFPLLVMTAKDLSQRRARRSCGGWWIACCRRAATAATSCSRKSELIVRYGRRAHRAARWGNCTEPQRHLYR